MWILILIIVFSLKPRKNKEGMMMENITKRIK